MLIIDKTKPATTERLSRADYDRACQKQRCDVCFRRSRLQTVVGHLHLCKNDDRYGSCWVRWVDEERNRRFDEGDSYAVAVRTF